MCSLPVSKIRYFLIFQRSHTTLITLNVNQSSGNEDQLQVTLIRVRNNTNLIPKNRYYLITAIFSILVAKGLDRQQSIHITMHVDSVNKNYNGTSL